MAIEKISDNKVRVIFNVTAQEFEDALDKAFETEKVKVNVRGFRKGCVPRRVFEREFGVESLYTPALMSIYENKYTQEVRENRLVVIGEPEIDIKPDDIKRGEDFVFAVVATIVALGEYKGIEVKGADFTVTDEEVANQIKDIRSKDVIVAPKEEGILSMSDIAIFDFTGYKDGVEFDGGKAENYELEIGSGQFIPGFEEQMVGMNLNEEKTINVTFPENYHAADLAGKAVEFKIKLNEMKKKELPELTDEYVKGLNMEGITSVSELEASIRKDLEAKKQEDENKRVVDELITKIVEKSNIELPEELVQSAVSKDYQRFQKNVENQYKMKFADFKSLAQINEDDLLKDIEMQTRKNLNEEFVIEAIIRTENISATIEEMEASLNEIAKINNVTVDFVKTRISPDDLAYNISINKAIEFLMSNAKVN